MLAIVYGSSTLNTQYVAERLHAAFGSDTARLYNVKEITPEAFQEFRSFVFVTSTWGAGDLQDDWEVFFPHLDSIDFSGKTVGLVGLGDQENYPDQFCDSIRILHDKVIQRGGSVVGFTGTDGYKFKTSRSVKDGRFVGLVIDEDNQSDQTDERIQGWVRSVSKKLRLTM
jgi:flavodoxin I